MSSASNSTGGGSSNKNNMAETYEVMIVVDPAVGMGLNIDTKNSCVIGEFPRNSENSST